MTSSRILRLCVCVVVLTGLARTAEAEIYKCSDAAGAVIALTDNPATCGTGRTYVVAGSSYRATRPSNAENPTAYDGIIAQASSDYEVRAELIRAVIQVESGFDPKARSPKGAMGLMQLMPATAAELGVRNPFNPTENIRGGVAYLRSLLDRYQDETLALAAYNAGPTAVEKYGNNVPPYRETEQYVDRVRNATTGDPVATVVSAGGGHPAGGRAGAQDVYKTLVLNQNGQLVPTYSFTKPSSGPYDVVRR